MDVVSFLIITWSVGLQTNPFGVITRLPIVTRKVILKHLGIRHLASATLTQEWCHVYSVIVRVHANMMLTAIKVNLCFMEF